MNFESIVEQQLRENLRLQEGFRVERNQKRGQSDTYTIFDYTGTPILIAKFFDYLGGLRHLIDSKDIEEFASLDELMECIDELENLEIDIEQAIDNISLQQRCFKRYVNVCGLSEIDCFPELVCSIEEIAISGSFYGLLVEKYVNGSTLEKMIKQFNKQDGLNIRVVEFLKQLGKMISKLSANGIVHRDISPDNIMCVEGEYILIDPGVVKIEDDNPATKTSMILGKKCYASPEQYKGNARTATFKSDLYAIGIIALEMVIGYNPLGKIIQPNPYFPHEELLRKYNREIEDIFFDKLEEDEFNSRLFLVIKKLVQIEDRARYDSVDSFMRALTSLEERML